MDVLLVDNSYLKKKKISINIKETELACAGYTYLEYILPGTPLLTPPPPPFDTKEEKQMIIRKNTEVLEEGHFSIHIIVTT